MSKGVSIVNHPSGRVVHVTRRNADRMIALGLAVTRNWRVKPGEAFPFQAWGIIHHEDALRLAEKGKAICDGIYLTEEYWQQVSDKIAVREMDRQLRATVGYDGMDRPLTVQEMAAIPIMRPQLALTLKAGGTQSPLRWAQRADQSKSGTTAKRTRVRFAFDRTQNCPVTQDEWVREAGAASSVTTDRKEGKVTKVTRKAYDGTTTKEPA